MIFKVIKLDEIIKGGEEREKRSKDSVLEHSNLRDCWDEDESAKETEDQPVRNEN